jgi:cytochrome c oxidase assembly protein subunit 15
MTPDKRFKLEHLYRRIGFFTYSSVFLLFFLGSLVRATGSGMGCPDWPRCFGMLAPPLSEEALPENYQEVFLEKRIKKLERFVGALEKVGLDQKAAKIRQDKSLLLPEEFDATKAWIEYINRLFGVLSGLFALIFFWLGFRLKIARGWLILGMIFLLLNGWLGSYVVATNLLPGLVSLHFMLSFICLFAFMKASDVSKPLIPIHSQNNRTQWVFLTGLLFVIVILGTWGREQVEMLKSTGDLADSGGSMLNIHSMDILFTVHRYSPLLVGLYGFLMFRQCQLRAKESHAFVMLLLSVFQILLGAIHILFLVPIWTQILHVVLGSGLLTYIFAVTMSYRHPQRGKN